MAARIIKGGGEVPQRPLASPARVAQVAQNKKVIGKDIYNASQKAQEVLSSGQSDVDAIQARGVQEAEAAQARAREEQSRASRQEAVSKIVAAYKKRGDTIARSRTEVLEVVNGLAAKVTGQGLSLPRTTSMAAIDRALRNRRGRFPAVVCLPAADLEVLRSHTPLTKALESAPEIRLEEGEGVLKVSGGEIPLDLAMAARALVATFQVPLPSGIAEQAGEEPAPQEQEEEEEEEAREAASAEEPEEEEQEEVAQAEQEEEPAQEEVATAAPLDDEAEADAAGEAPDPEQFGEEAYGSTEAGPSHDAPTATHGVVRSGSERSVVLRNPAGAAALLPSSPPMGTGVRRLPVEGTRVEISPANASRITRGPNAVPLDERPSGAQRIPAGVTTRGHVTTGDERSGALRLPPPTPRPITPADEDGATLNMNRDDLPNAGAGIRARPPASPGSRIGPAPTPPPVDGTRVDVRTPPAAPAREISGLNRRPR